MSARIAEAGTAFNADAVEFCPHERHRDLLVCANYQLDESSGGGEAGIEGEHNGGEGSSKRAQSRIGRYYLFAVREGEDGNCALEAIEERDTPSGIFDLKWCPVLEGGLALIALACADGALYLSELRDGEAGPALERIAALPVAAAGAMCLSLAWDSPGRSAVVSHSDGSVSLVERAGVELRRARSWPAHGFETWIAAWDAWSPHLAYSGGDDALFRGWDLRTDCSAPTFTSREHEAGVCSVSSSPHREHILASGSYDESLRVWDARSMRRPLCSAALGGGVWRIRWHPDPARSDTLAAACMHFGCHVLRFDAAGPAVESVLQYRGHGSLAYGIDWSWAGGGWDGLVASCSFYDRGLHLWRGLHLPS